MEDVAIVYSFQVSENPTGLQFALGPDGRQQIFDWLSGSRAESTTVEGQAIRISRALLRGSTEESPVQGVAVERRAQLVGVTQSTEKQWASDLQADRVGIYETVDREETVPIREV